jgi:adenylate cyclase
MTEQRVKRRLAAILAADVVGYSRLMEVDEAGTLTALKALRRTVLMPLLDRHDGRLVKVMGDGLIAEFASAVDAVQFALDLQESFRNANVSSHRDRRIDLRIGINLGDVIVEGNDLYGDGINIAARLEAIGEPESIFISGSVFEQVRRKLDAHYEYLGSKELKNIAEPVRVYRVTRGFTTSAHKAAERKSPRSRSCLSPIWAEVRKTFSLTVSPRT